MKVRVSFTVDVDEGYRRAILHHSGGSATKAGLATRAEVAHWFREYGDQMNDDLRYDHRSCCWRDAKGEDD